MKIPVIVALTACTAFLMLSACGEKNEAIEAQKSAVAEILETAAVAGTPAGLDWVPTAIVLPQPHTMVQNLRVSLRTNYLHAMVEKDPTSEIPKWKSSLLAAGYEVRDDGNRLMFKKEGVESGGVGFSKAENQAGFLIQVDVTDERER